MTRRHAQSGFTLLELTLASALTAALALTLYASLNIGFRARSSARMQMEAVREASIVMELLRQDLQSVPPPRGILAGPFVGHAMGTAGAEADSLEFHTLGRDAGEHGPLSDGMRRVRVLLRRDADPPVLVRRVERNLLAPVGGMGAEETLSRNVHAFVARYYDGQGWWREWDSTHRGNRLPLAVELTIELDRPSPADRSRRYRLTQTVPLSCGRASEMEDDPGVLLE